MRILGSLLAALLIAGCGKEEPSGPPTWKAVFEDLPGGLLRAWGTSSKDVYVVGADAEGTGPIALHFDGKRWRRLQPPLSGDLWWVQGVGPDDIRMVGDGGAVRYTPSTGAFEVRSTQTDMTLFGVWGASSTDVWYVGGNSGNLTGIILRDDGTSVRQIGQTETASATIFKAHGFDASNVWFVGQRGKILFWDGSALQERSPGTLLPVMGIHGTSPERLYAVGGVADGLFLAWDGQGWQMETPPGTPQMVAVWALDQEEVYAGGFNGRIFHREAGAWTELEEMIPTFQDLHSVWVDDQGSIWAVGGRLAQDPPSGGVLIHYGPPIPNEIE